MKLTRSPLEVQRVTAPYFRLTTENGKTELCIDVSALEGLEQIDEDEFGTIVRWSLLVGLGGISDDYWFARSGADSGVDQAETVTEPAPVNDDAVAGRAITE